MAPFAGEILFAQDERASAAARFAPVATPARERIRRRYFPDVELTTQDGKKLRFYDDLVKSKVMTLNMFFTTCPGVCPLIMPNLVKVQKLLGDRVGRDIFMYSITLDPKHDTANVLRQYAEMHGIGPGWLLLTGQPKDIELLRRKLGFTDPNPSIDKDLENHIGNIRYGNERLMLWGACPGLFRAEYIAKAISWVAWPEQKNAAT